MTTFLPGDRVWVDDDGLAALREIMARHGHPAPDNHRGVVDKTMAGLVYITFDDGAQAPYPATDTHHEGQDE